jgi:hypothetical protein
MSPLSSLCALTTPQLVRRGAQLAGFAKMAGTPAARDELNRLARRYAKLVAEREGLQGTAARL